ncbi:hypothetical protein HDU77_003750 [Chytriomyces hyalinus]|nr:hypothetical protein HDU77_003750 [Chytriomyces hyalinus]
MRADMTDADTAAFCIAAIMLAVMAHAFSSVKGATLLESFGGTLFESCYCIYTWSRSKCLIGETGGLYWILTALAVLNRILFTAQLITGLLFENKLASVEVYRDVGVASISRMFLLD